MTGEDEAARVKVRLRADDYVTTPGGPLPPVRQAPRHACPSCGMVHFVQGGGR